jgi:hypothetical protein
MWQNAQFFITLNSFFFFQTSGWVFQQAFKTVSEGSVFTANILDAAASLWDSGAKTAHYSRDAE